jgi:hypothetical protein
VRHKLKESRFGLNVGAPAQTFSGKVVLLHDPRARKKPPVAVNDWFIAHQPHRVRTLMPSLMSWVTMMMVFSCPATASVVIASDALAFMIGSRPENGSSMHEIVPDAHHLPRDRHALPGAAGQFLGVHLQVRPPSPNSVDEAPLFSRI